MDQLRLGVLALSRDLPVKRAVLFGSWASGRATAYSDIDILVVYEGPARDDAYRVVRHHISVRGLEPHVYAEAEAEAVGQMLERMTRGGVSLL